MTVRFCTTNRRKTPLAACLLLLILVRPPRSLAHDEWYRGLDLESALADSGLVLVGRVTDVSETKVGVGGKGERSLLQYKFEPVSVLKGVFSRESLLLTSDDLSTHTSPTPRLSSFWAATEFATVIPNSLWRNRVRSHDGVDNGGSEDFDVAADSRSKKEVFFDS
jgi:hypothetical protein